MQSRANLTDITDPANPVAVAGNLTLRLTMTDKGSPGTADSIGLTLWSAKTLLLASEWNGTNMVEVTLDGGNIVVH